MLDEEIDDFLAALAYERAMAQNTCEAYARDLRLFAAFLKKAGRRAAADVTRDDIAAFIGRERADGRASSTRARRMAAIRSWLRHLKARRRIRRDPTEQMATPKQDAILPRVLSEEEMARMLEGIKGTAPLALRDRALLEVLYGCGLRVSEVCGLKMEDIVDNGELLRILGKGSKERVVPLGSAAGRALRAYFASGRDALARGNPALTHVFVSRFAKPLTRQGVFKVVRARAAAVGIAAEKVSPHVLRHCFASHMLGHGADIRAIQELLGHADIATTQVYTHIDATRFGDIHRRFHPRS